MTRTIAVLLAAAIGAQVIYPLVNDSRRDAVTVAVVALLAVTAIVHASIARGKRWTLTMFLGTAGLGLLAEMIGTKTGFPFGSYIYATDRLGPDIFGVPAVVPLAWTAGFYPVWCAVTYVTECGSYTPNRAAVNRVVFTAVGMVGWDLYLDTQMVTDGQWTWTTDIAGLPGIASIPVSNYLGWFCVALVMSVIVEWASKQSKPGPQQISDVAPIVLFLWTWLGSAMAHAVLLDGPELRYSAGYGFLVMGVVGGPLVRTWIGEKRRTRSSIRQS